MKTRTCFAALTAVLGTVALAPAAQASPYRCTMTYSLTGGNTAQRALIQRTVLLTAKATGQWYQYTTGAAQLSITVSSRAASPLLQIDGNTDSGYTTWSPDHADIALLDTTPTGWLSALTAHELMLSRHLIEGPDPHGLLDHTLHALYYSSADLAMLAGTDCL